MLSTSYNPDVLTCLANLSNDEVFTPPNVVNDILDQLPPELWSDKKITFLDPVSKSGVFLREIAKRLIEGLKDEIPDQQERLNHIFKKQLFGIALTELTALLSRRSVYCSKNANGEYSICEEFDNESGNVRFERIEHSWVRGKCKFCGASEEVFSRGDQLETHAYEFIHNNNIEEIFGMKFDVIIGNPPYQLDTGGSGRQAKPIYQKFVSQAKKLNPRFLVMIIPARWYSGGFGLNDFRKEMLNDKSIRTLVDFENASEVFPGVDIAGGVCYFVWDRDYSGDCVVKNYNDGSVLKRPLNEHEIFIRRSEAIQVIRKIRDKHHKFLNQMVSPIRPFDLPTNYRPRDDGIPCRYIQKIGVRYAAKGDVLDSLNILNKWKLLIPKAPIAGQTDFSKPIRFYHDRNTLVSPPGECCTESWIVAGSFDSEKEVLSFKSYLFTKVVRYLILQTVISQDVNRKNFAFVPALTKYEGCYTDNGLINEWGINEDEWNIIDERILPAELAK
jgi:site-specific DNA-methyltransferase (adenine-specific)